MVAVLMLACAVAQEIHVERDNSVIDRSGTVVIDGIILDVDENGVIQITADDIELDFAGAHLRGAEPGTPPEQYRGYGVRITGKNVKIQNLRVSGFKAGIYGSGCDRLTLIRCDVSDNFRQRLKSTPEAENLDDWLYPHDNDNNEWLHKWGAGIYIEEASDVTVGYCRARDGQNGLCMRAVNDSHILRNDFSFLSGWGIALFRSNENVIAENVCDFCIRGYSHGVYSRGQDSAGILFFEQCSENLVSRNSATHGGDGFFGFAGKSALEGPDAGAGIGCNRNRIMGNDFSYAAANAIEMTFSFDNHFLENVLNGSHYGIWGGYSSRGSAFRNEIRNNHIAGVAIEHGHHWSISSNRITGNGHGVQVWWDEDPDLLAKPWAKQNPTAARDHFINDNEIGGAVGIQLRGGATASGSRNRWLSVGTRTDIDAESAWHGTEGAPVSAPLDECELAKIRSKRGLHGRRHIIMTEYGPYDFEGPFARRRVLPDGGHVIDIFGPHDPVEVTLTAGRHIQLGSIEPQDQRERPHMLRRQLLVQPLKQGGYVPYTVSFKLGDESFEFSGALMSARWQVRMFRSPCDPREDVEAWRLAAKDGVACELATLDLPYRSRGPSELRTVPENVKLAALPRDGFGTIATTTLEMPAGQWEVSTISDDGVRVWADDALLIDNWTHHGPTTDTGELKIEVPRKVTWRVEHFELDGYAQLSFSLQKK